MVHISPLVNPLLNADLFPALTLPPIRPNTDPRANTFDHSHDSLPRVPSLLNMGAWEHYLSDYPDRMFVSSLLQIIRVGATTGFGGEEKLQRCENLRSAAEHPAFVADAVEKLVHSNFARELPIGPESRLSPVGVVSRKRNVAKRRLINHLSWPRGSSVNDGIPDTEASISYDMFERAIADLVQAGPNSKMAKLDLKEAFHQIPVRESEWHLLGVTFDDRVYFMTVLTFGLRSAPYIFNMFSEALHWIISKYIPAHLRHYLDDFWMLFSSDTPDNRSHAAVEWVMALGHQLGLRFQDSKTEWPTYVIEFLGLILDSIRMEARLPEDKLAYLQDLLLSWEGKKQSSLKEVAELGGYLQFCAQVIPCARTFLRRIFDFSASFDGKPFTRRRVPSGVRSDIAWWLAFSREWNGIRLLQPSAPTLHIYTDASGTKGLGGYFGDLWFCTRVARRHRAKDIQFKELYAILHAILCWGHTWSGQHIVFHCDNQDVVSWLTKGTGRSKHAMPILRIVIMIAVCLKFSFSCVWLPSAENAIADAASRFQYSRMFDLAPYLSSKSSSTISRLNGIKRILTTLGTSQSSSTLELHPALVGLTLPDNDPTSTLSSCTLSISRFADSRSQRPPERFSNGLPVWDPEA